MRNVSGGARRYRGKKVQKKELEKAMAQLRFAFHALSPVKRFSTILPDDFHL